MCGADRFGNTVEPVINFARRADRVSKIKIVTNSGDGNPARGPTTTAGSATSRRSTQ